MAKLEGRVALVTGAGSGIGRAAATRLTQEGAKVGLLDLDPNAVEFPEGSNPLTRGQAGTPEQVADLVLFLASDDSRHITGTEISIDGDGSLLVG